MATGDLASAMKKDSAFASKPPAKSRPPVTSAPPTAPRPKNPKAIENQKNIKKTQDRFEAAKNGKQVPPKGGPNDLVSGGGKPRPKPKRPLPSAPRPPMPERPGPIGGPPRPGPSYPQPTPMPVGYPRPFPGPIGGPPSPGPRYPQPYPIPGNPRPMPPNSGGYNPGLMTPPRQAPMTGIDPSGQVSPGFGPGGPGGMTPEMIRALLEQMFPGVINFDPNTGMSR